MILFEIKKIKRVSIYDKLLLEAAYISWNLGAETFPKTLVHMRSICFGLTNPVM